MRWPVVEGEAMKHGKVVEARWRSYAKCGMNPRLNKPRVSRSRQLKTLMKRGWFAEPVFSCAFVE